MIKEAIAQMSEGKDLSRETAEICMDEIMSGEASQMQMAAYLTALRMKGETVDEIVASASGMRNHATKLHHDRDVLEIVGTGGDEAYSFNISTTASIVAAAAGVAVAKHGNRSVSSKCGAADVLEELGVDIGIEPEKMERVLQKTGVSFLYAQVYHKAMRFVAPVRKDLGIRTIFNILGPLSNPAFANLQLMGVYSEELVRPMAEVLSKLGVKRGMVVYGRDRLDEISISAPTLCCEIKNGTLQEFEIEPEQFGIRRGTKADMQGGDPKENAKITKAILSGEERGAKRDAVLLNAGIGIYLAKEGISMEEGIREAAEAIDSGRAAATLEAFIRETNA